MSNNEMTNTKEKAATIRKEDEITEVLPEVEAAKTAASPKPKTVADATFKSTSVALIEKLLQFSTPRLDVKIVNVLFLEGKSIEHAEE